MEGELSDPLLSDDEAASAGERRSPNFYLPLARPRLAPQSGVLMRVDQPCLSAKLAEAIKPRRLTHPLPVRPKLTGYLPFEVVDDIATHVLSNAEISVLRQAVMQRKVPPAARDRAVNSACEAAKKDAGGQLTEMFEAQLAAQTYSDLLKSALVDERETAIYYHHGHGYVFIGERTQKAALDAVSTLDGLLKTSPAQPFRFNQSVEAKMTQWLLELSPPEGFSFGQSAVLLGPNKAKAKFEHHDLTSKEVLDHLRAGHQVHELQLAYGTQVEMTLTGTGFLRNITLLEPDPVEDCEGLSSAMIEAIRYANAVIPAAAALLTAVGGQFGRASRPAGEQEKGECSADSH